MLNSMLLLICPRPPAPYGSNDALIVPPPTTSHTAIPTQLLRVQQQQPPNPNSTTAQQRGGTPPPRCTAHPSASLHHCRPPLYCSPTKSSPRGTVSTTNIAEETGLPGPRSFLQAVQYRMTRDFSLQNITAFIMTVKSTRKLMNHKKAYIN
jgi:hypothetical protein